MRQIYIGDDILINSVFYLQEYNHLIMAYIFGLITNICFKLRTTFTIHTTTTNPAQMTVLDLLDASIKLLQANMAVALVLVSYSFDPIKPFSQQPLTVSRVKVSLTN